MGSSDAVAALIGAHAVLFAADRRIPQHDWPAQVYSIFVSYLSALALGGAAPSFILGDASVAVLFTARRALRPATLSCVALLVVLLAAS